MVKKSINLVFMESLIIVLVQKLAVDGIQVLVQLV